MGDEVRKEPLRRVLAAAAALCKPVGLALIPLVMRAVNAEWPSAALMACLLAVSSRHVAAAELASLLLWAGTMLSPFLASVFPDSLDAAALAALQAGALVAVMLAGWPVTLFEAGAAPKWLESRSGLVRTLLLSAATGFLAASLFRPMPAAYAGWACAAALYARRMRGPGAEKRAGSGRVLGGAALLVVSTALGFAVVETGARWLLPEPEKPSDIFTPDPDAIYTLAPGSQTQITLVDEDVELFFRREEFLPNDPELLKKRGGESLPVPIATSSQGLRDRVYPAKAPGEYRIVLLGDSFTWGHGLTEDQVISRRMERLLSREGPPRITVINCGVGGYAPAQERHFLRKRGLPLSPDLVVLQLYPPNDVYGSYALVGKRLQSFKKEFEIRLQNFRKQHEFPFRAERWLQTHSNAYGLFLRAAGLEAPVRMLTAELRFVPPTAPMPGDPPTDRDPHREVCLINWYPDLEEAWALYADAILGIRNDCRDAGVRFAAYTHGDSSSLDPDLWEELNARHPKTPYEMNKDIRLTNELLDELGVPHPDLLEALKEHPDPKELYYVHNGHFTPLGVQVVAECLARFVRRTFLPEN